MAIKDWIPEKIKKRPFVTVAVVIGSVVILAFLSIYMLEKACAVLTTEWCQNQLGGIIEGTRSPKL